MDETKSTHRKIDCQVDVPAPIIEVWNAWTTEEGARSFFAPDCRIDLRPGGEYEMFFDPGVEPGQRGGEGNKVMAVQSPRMLSFTWNAPPFLPEVRNQMTHVEVRLEEWQRDVTRVRLTHDGWGAGGEWDLAFDYFTRAWTEIVLPRLRYMFENGPVDWSDPPAPGANTDRGE